MSFELECFSLSLRCLSLLERSFSRSLSLSLDLCSLDDDELLCSRSLSFEEDFFSSLLLLCLSLSRSPLSFSFSLLSLSRCLSLSLRCLSLSLRSLSLLLEWSLRSLLFSLRSLSLSLRSLSLLEDL